MAGLSEAERARSLAERVDWALLSTVARDPAGYPFGSLVAFALHQGQPVLLLSGLAEHTKNLAGDARASLLVAEPGAGDPLARGRVTLIGRCGPDPAGRAAYLARHPEAARYEQMRDFAYYRLSVEEVRWVGGFGRMAWIDAGAWTSAQPDPLAAHAGDILAHMNHDHADAVLAMARTLGSAADAESAVMHGVDRLGIDLAVRTPAGPRTLRLDFAAEALTPDACRAELIALTKRARA